MLAIITGDIVDSRSINDPTIWMDPLKELFNKMGETPRNWEIYRGDSFQIEVAPEESLRIALVIKSIIKKLKTKKLDVRIAIGIGEKNFEANYVSESTGEAFVFSGTLLDELKKNKVHLGIQTPWSRLNSELNMMFKLALVVMNSWTSKSAEVAELLFDVSEITQVEIANRLGIAQSTVNDRVKRGSIYEIIELEQYFRNRIKEIKKEEVQF